MTTTTPMAVEARGIRKLFGETIALDGLDLDVPQGMVYGVLGPNGAGKTTLIRILATLLPHDVGTARIFGHDVNTEAEAVRGRVAMTGQFASVDEDPTGLENLIMLCRLLGYTRADARRRAMELLDAFGLGDASDRQVKKYSGGMRRRIDIAASIVVTPDLMFLDEPTTGLDPRSRNQVWEIIRLLVSEGTTVLLTTQYLDEADQLADRIAVIDNGRVIAEGTSGQLKSSIGVVTLHVRVLEPEQRPKAEEILAATLSGPIHLESDPVALTISVSDQEKAAYALGELARSGVEVTNFSMGQPSLDEVFLAITGHPPEHETDDDPAADPVPEEVV